MKRVMFMLFVACTLINCTKEEEQNLSVQEATIIGRWNPVGFEGSVMYEFTENKRYTFYSLDGKFETIEELESEGRRGNDWKYEGDVVVIDLNFGNFSRLRTQFTCDNNVINWIDEEGEPNGSFFRENFDKNSCKE